MATDNAVVKLRHSLQKTQDEFAAELKISKRALCRYERGETIGPKALMALRNRAAAAELWSLAEQFQVVFQNQYARRHRARVRSGERIPADDLREWARLADQNVKAWEFVAKLIDQIQSPATVEKLIAVVSSIRHLIAVPAGAAEELRAALLVALLGPNEFGVGRSEAEREILKAPRGRPSKRARVVPKTAKRNANTQDAGNGE